VLHWGPAHQVILEGEAQKKSFGTFCKKIFVYIKIVLVAESSINAVQSLQLEHGGLSNFYEIIYQSEILHINFLAL